MKKLLFIISIIAVMMLMCVAVGAKEVDPVTGTYYVVQSYDSEAAVNMLSEGKSIVSIGDLITTNGTGMGVFFNNVEDNDHIELILAENIYSYSGTENRGILINKPITVTIRYNGFVHAVKDSSSKTGIYVKHVGAYLRCIGSKALVDGELTTQFVNPKFANDKITSVGNVDAYHGKVYIWVDDGSVYMENMCTYSGQEGLFARDGSNYTVYDNFKLINCSFGSESTSLGLIGGGVARKIIEIDNCYIDKKFEACTVMTGSYVKNTKINGAFYMDCWDITGQLFEFENCEITGSISTATGRTHLQFINCKFDSSKISLGSDGGGGCRLYAITTATCETAGTKITYKNGTTVGEIDTNYPIQNPPYHIVDELNATAISYENYLSKGIYTAPCVRCGKVITEEKGTASELFVFLGYSTPEDGSYGIVASYTVNKNALSKYERLSGKTLSYGVVAGVKSSLGSNNPLDKDGNEIKLTDSVIIKTPVNKNNIAYDFLIKDMNASQLDLELVIATYVLTTEDKNTTLVYLQEAEKVENLGAISYNAIPKEEEQE